MLGRTVALSGELRSSEDLTIEGRVSGTISCDGCVLIAASAEIDADVLARDITVLGQVTGQLTATEVVQLVEGARMTGRVISPRFILAEGAVFNGRVEPQHLDAALSVARYRQRKQQEAGVATADPRQRSSSRTHT
jgi:cytoskeletal protein CcmA (bactofilin family)